MDVPSDHQHSFGNDQQNKLNVGGDDLPRQPERSERAIYIDQAAAAQSARVDVQHDPHASHLIGGAFWFFATVCLVLVAWFVGPMAVQKYQYSATRGRVQAEYENAVALLKDAPLNDVSRAYQLVAQKIRPSVVSVQSEAVARIGRQQIMTGGQGSGVILSESGFVITNEHVVRDASSVLVTLHDRRQYDARVIGTDALTDLAVLKINATELIPAEWGNSDGLQVGSMVWAVGSPYGLQQTVTSGILSAKDRPGRESFYQEFLQTDAAVNPGNSGGPLVNAKGEVVGINTSIYGEKFQGISFAVPSAVAQYVFEQIKSNGNVSRGFLGIQPRVVLQEDVQKLNLPDFDGALVQVVEPFSPADKAGLRPNDVIRHWGGNTVKQWNRLYRYIGMTKPDTNTTVGIIRDGKAVELEIPVIERGDFRFAR